MPDYTSSAKSILCDLLGAGPVRGARLKLLFSHAFEGREGVPYAEAFAQFSKFSDLLGQHLDVLQIDRPDGPGDVTVRLREGATAIGTRPPQGAQASASLFMRPDLWQALTNPDPRRRRFVHCVTGEIVHFLADSDAEPNPRIAERVAREPQFVEIRAISAETQRTWMQDFVESGALTEARRRIVAPVLDLPYSSQVNTLFAGGLGEQAEAWRGFRARRVADYIRQWCSEKGLEVENVLRPGGVQRHLPTASESPAQLHEAAVKGVATGPHDAGDLRRSLVAALEQMTEEELSRVLFPASALLRIHSHRAQ